MFSWLKDRRRERQERQRIGDEEARALLDAKWAKNRADEAAMEAEIAARHAAYAADQTNRKRVAADRILNHGFMPLAFFPGVTAEMLEGFADELDQMALRRKGD